MRKDKVLIYNIDTTGEFFWLHGIYRITGIILIDNEEVEKFTLEMKPNPAAKIDLKAFKYKSDNPQTIQTFDSMTEGFSAFKFIMEKHLDKFDRKDRFYLVGWGNANKKDSFLKAWFIQNNFRDDFALMFFPEAIDLKCLLATRLRKQRDTFPVFTLQTVLKAFGSEIEDVDQNAPKYVEGVFQLYALCLEYFAL